MTKKKKEKRRGRKIKAPSNPIKLHTCLKSFIYPRNAHPLPPTYCPYVSPFFFFFILNRFILIYHGPIFHQGICDLVIFLRYLIYVIQYFSFDFQCTDRSCMIQSQKGGFCASEIREGCGGGWEGGGGRGREYQRGLVRIYFCSVL